MMPPTVSIAALIVTVRPPVNVTAPGPRARLLLPRKVKLRAQVCVLLLLSVMAAPLVLSIEPPLIVKVPVPMAVALLMFSWPAESVMPLEKVLAPDKVNVPAPALVRLWATEMTPPTVSIPASMVTVGFPVSDTAPVPRFRLLLPTKVKLPLQVCALLLLRVMAAPLALSIVPPLMVKVPVPTAAALSMFSWPAESVMPLEKVLAPDKVNVPAPASVRLLAPEMTPPTVSMPASIVTVGFVVSVTVPVPRFRLLLPSKVKLATQL